ncbi:MAG: thiosulfate ABC transporter substrate-binding protein CysP [Gammaproteobacteria bacterium]|nr:thiosulfate ABC transporter substrate-binding protein CysP [Gammaproteobacteria bacterium]MBU2158254.1 thiosulfate ABC transporter substrate-binding protein CysP [Gammaproteobacteria bacterium]MBU2254333.1 thiosulfate ABC transporter substrate-binding protein CysP [Gammaproteobacteria bacterium]MBU2296344.1 thiosulfate ABC transporter substrate-binding protein CysP [Gammaproteobacteria bacterium]
MLKKILLASAITSSLLSSAAALADDAPILNASYDIARELFAEINPKFVAHWKEQTGKELKIDQSFAGSSRQAQDIIQGKKVDTVTFNQVTDVDILAKRGLLREDWAKQFPNNSSPYYSTTAFLVRKGNPKNIKDWNDLARDDVKLVFPNPKTSGNARYSYLGAWLYANEQFKGDESQIKTFVGKVLRNVENFPTGGRAATVAFAQNGQGDVLLTFESEVVNIANGEEFKSGEYEIVVPPVSVLAEFPVALVDKVVDQKGTREASKAYLDFQYSKDIQQLLTSYNYRVHNPEVVAATAAQFPQIRLINPTEVLGTWDEITAKHFDADGILDQLLAEGR